jgi:hypothetical protein
MLPADLLTLLREWWKVGHQQGVMPNSWNLQISTLLAGTRSSVGIEPVRKPRYCHNPYCDLIDWIDQRGRHKRPRSRYLVRQPDRQCGLCARCLRRGSARSWH